MKFEEHKSQLFRILEKPVPLTPDAEMPCLVRFITHGVIGEYVREHWLDCNQENVPIYIDDVDSDGDVTVWIDENRNEHHCCPFPMFEIIGYPVVEGSKEWALYQMMQGKKVCHKKSPSIAYYKHSSGIRRHVRRNYVDSYMSIDAWLDGADRNGWQLYEPEPKPLLADAKVGDLVKRRDGHWAQIIETSGGVEFQPIEYLYNKRLIAVTINGSYTVYNDYMQDDIVEHQPLAPEGSSEWALQMWKLGNDIRNETGVVIRADYESEEIRVKHLVDVFPSGWQIYKEHEPPKYKVGDWVEVECQNKLYHKQVLFVTENRVGFEFSGTTPSVCFDGTPSHIFKFIRKLSPSEVIVHIGCLSGTIARSCDPNYFLMLHSRPATDCNNSMIRFSALDTETREIVESLLEAQEEKQGREMKHTRESLIAFINECRKNGTRIDLSGLDMGGLDMSGLDLRGALVQNSNLQGTNLYGANLYGANLRGSNLREANLQCTILDYAGYELSCKTIGIKADKRLVSHLLYHLCSMDVSGCPEWDELRNDERVIALANKSHVIREHGLPEIKQTNAQEEE